MKKGSLPVDSAFAIALGKRIRRRRRNQGLAQWQLGARLGISFQQVQKHEAATTRISLERFLQYCAVLNCRPDDLLYDLYEQVTPIAPSTEKRA